METQTWLNRSLPQMLYNAVLLLYIRSAFDVLAGGLVTIYGLAFVGAQVAAGYGISNERRWGYKLGVGVALAPAVLRFALFGFEAILGINIISLLFEILLIVLLLHHESREHQRIWFR